MVNEAQRRIAESFEVEASGLREIMNKGIGVENLGRFKSIFTPEQEHILAEHCRQMNVRFYGLTFTQLVFV